METKDQHIQKRAYERMSVDLDARFFYGNIFYTGNVVNLSENGMFIHTRTYLPYQSIIPVMIFTDDRLLSVLARVKRIVSRSNPECGMGVEIVNPDQNYLEYTEHLRTM